MAVTASAAGFGTGTGEKAGVLMVHFGTTYDDTRSRTIDVINRIVADSFPDMDVREAYSSRIVRRRLASRGIDKPTPREALLRMAADGYTHVIVQATHLLDGIEAEALRDEVAAIAPFFTDIRVGRPAMQTTDDCLVMTDILAGRYADRAKGRDHVVFIGHGSPSVSNAVYSQLDHMLASAGHTNMHVATIEGYPTLATTLPRLKDARKVTLVPLLFVAGDHASNDIANDWREAVEADGHQVEVILEGLGEVPAVQAIFSGRVKEAIDNAPRTATEIKQASIRENP